MLFKLTRDFRSCDQNKWNIFPFTVNPINFYFFPANLEGLSSKIQKNEGTEKTPVPLIHVTEFDIAISTL